MFDAAVAELSEASPAYFAQNATDARTALATVADASDAVRRLLVGGHMAIQKKPERL